LVLKKWFGDQDIPTNVDSLVKDKNGRLQLFDLNGPSFVGWFKDEVSVVGEIKVKNGTIYLY